MPSEKRSYGRVTSGNARPHKTARFGHESMDENGDLSNGDSDRDMMVDDAPVISAAPRYQNLDPKYSSIFMKMKVAQGIVQPSSLAALKNQFYYNLTPQQGYHLPAHINRAVLNRIVRPTSRDGSNKPPKDMPYLHLGFTTFLNMQIFIFLPNLPLDNCHEHDPSRIHESVLEKWTDSVFLPSIASSFAKHDPRAPSSWRLADLYKTSPAWFDMDIAPFPTFKIFDSQEGRYFADVWKRLLDLSMPHREFQHPFVILYTTGEGIQPFAGDSPDEMMRNFERAWHEHIDMAYVDFPEDNLNIGFSYSNSVHSLPMR